MLDYISHKGHISIMRNTGQLAVITAVLAAGSVMLTGCGDQRAPVKKPVCTSTPAPSASIPASYIHINVLNATANDGLAGKVGTALSWRGYQVIETASNPQDDPRPTPKYAEIRYGSGGYQMALTLATQVQHATMYDDHRSDPSIDLVLGPSFKLAALPPPAATSVTVNVYNTTARPGLATSIGKQMRDRGFKTDHVGNDPLGSFNPDLIAIVRYGAKGEPAARRVALSVKGAKLVLDGRDDSSVDLVLNNKFVGLAPAAQATASMTPKPARTCS